MKESDHRQEGSAATAGRRVVVTGLGCVTPLGHSVAELWAGLVAGRSGVAATTVFNAGAFPTKFSAEVKNYRLKSDLADSERFAQAGRGSHFLLGAAAQAWRDSGLAKLAGLDLDQVGMYLASGEGSLDFDAFVGTCLNSWQTEQGAIDMVAWAQQALTRMDAMREFEQEPHAALSHLAMLTGASGPSFNTITACAASAQAIGEATQIVRRGDADVMITGGAHSMIHPFGVTGFNRLTTLSTRNHDPEGASRPFDAGREGFVLGEGAGVIILEELEHARRRGAKILAEVIGYGSTADAYRITDQHPESAGMIEAMREAILDAGVAPETVDYVNAHGTGTRENDGHETAAIHAVFGPHARKIAVSSIKSMTGHLITAAGAIEFIACVLAIQDQILPPTINLTSPDPACDLDYVPNVARKSRVKTVLTNNVGFGGQNDALVLRQFEGA